MGSQQDPLAKAVRAFLHHQHTERGYEVRGGEGEQSRLGRVQEGTELGQQREQRRGEGRTEGGMPALTKGCPLPRGRLRVADQHYCPRSNTEDKMPKEVEGWAACLPQDHSARLQSQRRSRRDAGPRPSQTWDRAGAGDGVQAFALNPDITGNLTSKTVLHKRQVSFLILLLDLQRASFLVLVRSLHAVLLSKNRGAHSPARG